MGRGKPNTGGAGLLEGSRRRAAISWSSSTLHPTLKSLVAEREREIASGLGSGAVELLSAYPECADEAGRYPALDCLYAALAAASAAELYRRHYPDPDLIETLEGEEYDALKALAERRLRGVIAAEEEDPVAAIRMTPIDAFRGRGVGPLATEMLSRLQRDWETRPWALGLIRDLAAGELAPTPPRDALQEAFFDAAELTLASRVDDLMATLETGVGSGSPTVIWILETQERGQFHLRSRADYQITVCGRRVGTRPMRDADRGEWSEINERCPACESDAKESNFDPETDVPRFAVARSPQMADERLRASSNGLLEYMRSTGGIEDMNVRLASDADHLLRTRLKEEYFGVPLGKREFDPLAQSLPGKEAERIRPSFGVMNLSEWIDVRLVDGHDRAVEYLRSLA